MSAEVKIVSFPQRVADISSEIKGRPDKPFMPVPITDSSRDRKMFQLSFLAVGVIFDEMARAQTAFRVNEEMRSKSLTTESVDVGINKHRLDHLQAVFVEWGQDSLNDHSSGPAFHQQDVMVHLNRAELRDAAKLLTRSAEKANSARPLDDKYTDRKLDGRVSSILMALGELGSAMFAERIVNKERMHLRREARNGSVANSA